MARLRGRDEAARSATTTSRSSSGTASSPGITILLTLVTGSLRCWTPTVPSVGAPGRARDLPRRARPGAARRDHGLLRPQSLARALALPALGGAADARRDRGARGLGRPQRGVAAAAAAARAARRRLLRRARRDRDVRDGRRAAFPGSFDDEPIQRLGSFYPAMWLHVRATAVFGISFALLVVWLARRRSRHLRFGAARARRARRADGGRRDPVPDRHAVVDRAHPRHARDDPLGGDRRVRGVALAAADGSRMAR